VREERFPQWIRRIRELKEEQSAAEFRRAAEQGLRQSWAAGVTCVAETGSTGAALAALDGIGGRGLYYQEVFGPDPASATASLADLEAAIERLRPLTSTRRRLGVSPHAPYTVSAPLYRAVAAFARRERLPIAVHVAESPAETELVKDGAGPFADLLRARGIGVEPRGCSPVQYLVQLGVVAETGCLCVHCVHVDDVDVGLLRALGAAIAHCPRSNRAHEHGTAPLARFRAAGIPTGLGTDSIVSTGDLALWPEAAAAGLSGEEALRLLTYEGARALGWESEIGSLEIGKQADLAVFASTALDRPRPPSTALLTVVAGRVVHR
jgi:5-methylthioadenosine/S-adenosylhomocysteine deaminase